jgi:dihydrofolate reductase
VHTVLEGDAFFPEIDTEKWKQASNQDCYADEKHKFDFSFQLWEKR